MKVLRVEVSVYNVYITNQFQSTFAQEGRGVKSFTRGDGEKQGGKLLRLLSQLRLRILSKDRSIGQAGHGLNRFTLWGTAVDRGELTWIVPRDE